MTSEESSMSNTDSEPTNQEESQVRDEFTQSEEPATSDAIEDNIRITESSSTSENNNNEKE